MLMELLGKEAAPQDWELMGVRMPSLSQSADLLQGPGEQACHSRSLGDKGILGS